ncbi:MAG: flagellar basal body rod protein FlgC [Pseudomonadales bacterium]|nr:flagellar basal body rod protein FlgC [Pseudomonadales bacterium]
MNLNSVFKVTGSALNAQSVQMEVISNNLANARIAAGSERSAYRAVRPVFASILNSQFDSGLNSGVGRSRGGVKVDGFAYSDAPIEKQRMPENPMADDDGYIYLSNVNVVEEMAYMMQASRAYQANIEVLNTSRQLIARTLNLGNM